MATVKVTDATFKTEVEGASEPVVVDFLGGMVAALVR